MGRFMIDVHCLRNYVRLKAILHVFLWICSLLFVICSNIVLITCDNQVVHIKWKVGLHAASIFR